MNNTIPFHSATHAPQITVLAGPVIFYRTDGHSAIVSLTVEDIYRFQTYLESHSTTLMADGQKLTCICID